MEEKIEKRPLVFGDIVKTISEDKRLKPDLMKCENGANFRAISESAILDAISPVLNEKGVYYTIWVKDSHLDIKEVATAKGTKYIFVATVSLEIAFYSTDSCVQLATTDAVGMGIDDGDKAMGKAYTYAVKYALLKVFRLRYGDDPDHDASKPIIKAPAAEPAQASKKPAAKEAKKPAAKGSAKKPASFMTEKQRDYIIGLMEQNKVSVEQIQGEFDVDVAHDKDIPMATAQRIISWFKEDGFLPF